MNFAQLLFPDFWLILCGYLLCRYTALNRKVWEPLESLVYYFLFPVLLFQSIVRSPLDLGAASALVGAGLSLERQLEAIGGGESALEAELECLKAVLENPQSCLRIEPRQLGLSPMNLVVDESSTDPAASVDFALAHLSGSPPMRRAFVLARLARTGLPSVQKINFDDVARYL